MPYRTILVHVDESERASERIRIAAEIARVQNSHLIGAAMTGVADTFMQTVNQHNATLSGFLRHLRERANHALAHFEAMVSKIGLASFEKRLIEDDAAAGISVQARYCDLVVIGQSDPAESSPAAAARDFPEYAVLNCPRGVLIIPHEGEFASVGRMPLIGWNGSKEAARAVSNAMPFLEGATSVQAVMFSRASRPRRDADQIKAELSLYLARHGIQLDFRQSITGTVTGEALLSHAADLACDLIVMGGYGHPRFREIVLGGVTRTVLESMTVPVLMSH